VITIANLSKSFRGAGGPVVALDAVSMEIPTGVIYGVVGPSGAGKSTLARCVALAEKPDQGAVLLDGTDLVRSDGRQLRAARREIGLVPPGDALLRQRTAAGNIALPLEAAGVSGPQRRSKVAELLDLVGLTGKAAVHPHQLSDGQRQRVAIARALAVRPSVLLADDPTAQLDPGMADAVLTVLERARSELGVTVVVTAQDVAVTRRVADEVAVLESGRLVEKGKVLDLVADPNSRVSSALLPVTAGVDRARYDVRAEVVLVGFAAVGALLPETASRFGVELYILGGGMTRLGDTPVAKFRIGLRGERAETALTWMIDRDAHVRRTPVCVDTAA
jgi:D-methionine transport system ATP-binding protein